MSNVDINKFRSFIQKSEIFLQSYSNDSKCSREATSEQRTKVASKEIEFKQFIEASIPLIIEPIKNDISLLKDHVSLINKWHTPVDILDIADVTRIEDSYTKIIAWALAPETHLPSALVRQKTWLDSLGISYVIDQPCKPETFVYTDDGIPDLMLTYDKFIVIVEAKTDSREHKAPSGEPQTKAYVEVIKKSNPTKKIIMVFLTIDEHSAQNIEATNTTYFHFACLLAEALSSIELPTDLKWAYSTVITHFINKLTPPEIDTNNIMSNINEWCKNLNDTSNNQKYLAKNIKQIAPYLNLIEKGRLT